MIVVAPLVVLLLEAAEPSSAPAAVAAPATTAATVADGSVFNLDASWKDASGKDTKLSALKGTPIVLAMIYTSCRAACPLIIQDVQAIERQLDDQSKARVRFVLVSFDPARDTPAKLSALAREHGLDAARWTLLTGNDDGVRELAAVLGMKYRLAGSDFVHSSIITLLDKDGVIRAQQVGVKRDTQESVAVLKELLR